ncbi:MAG: hypothetical protein M1837_006160 [Sclerophora amabilis]|nr:MAG: hypothetical protein M1837_006160 [Sclerophora amabilis]
MPDNTWITPYRLPSSRCLSLGPSQGMVYKLDENVVVKLPFQYPVDDTSPETDDHLFLSLQSFALFKKESHFYSLLAEAPHPHIARSFRNGQAHALFMECLDPLEEVWGRVTRDTRLGWTTQLLDALAWMESLGYIHGDITIRNMGVDRRSQLKLYDFGSIVHKDEENFHLCVLDDHFSLANTIHFLASGVDPLAKADSLPDLRRIEADLREGTAAVEEEARDLEQVIQDGWRRIPRSKSGFSDLRKIVAEMIGHDSTQGLPHRPDNLSLEVTSPHPFLSDEEPQWMNEEEYRIAWMEKGYTLPTWT